MQPHLTARSQVMQGATTLLAIGGYGAILGVVFMTPFLLNARAQENDVFMTNLYLSPLFFLSGSTLLILGLDRLGLRHSLTGALAIGNPIILLLATWLAGKFVLDGIRAIAVGILVDALLLAAMTILIVGALRRWNIGGYAAALAVSGAALVSLGYFLFGSRYYAFGEITSSLPPYLDGTMIGLGAATGLAILWISRKFSQV